MPIPGLDLGLPPEEELTFSQNIDRMVAPSRVTRPNIPTWTPYLEDMKPGSKTPSYRTDSHVYGTPPDRPIEGGRNEGKNYKDVYPEQDRMDPDAIPFGRDNLALADDLVEVVRTSLPGVVQYGPHDLIDGRFSNLNPPTPGSTQDEELIRKYGTFGAPDTKALWDMYSRDMEIPGQLPGSDIPSWDDLKIQGGEKQAGEPKAEKQEEFTEEAGVPGQKYETPASISMGKTFAKYKDYEEFAEEAGVPPGPTRTWGETLSKFSVSNAMKLITDAAAEGKSTEEQALAFEQGFILPMIKGMYEGIKNLREMELVNPETGEVNAKVPEEAFLNALNFVAPGYARALAAPKGSVELGMFGGQRGRGFHKADREGRTVLGAEGRQRYEFSDRDMEWQPAITTMGLQPGVDVNLGTIIRHDVAFEQYPALRNMRVKFDDTLAKGEARFNPDKKFVTINPNSLGTAEGLRNIAHEMQHWIQKTEGFNYGSNPLNYTETASTVKSILNLPQTYFTNPQNLDMLKRMTPNFNSLEAAMVDAGNDFFAVMSKMFPDRPAIKKMNSLGEVVNKIQEAKEKQYLWAGINYKIGNDIYRADDYFQLLVENYLYRRSRGEVEAENVVSRLRFTDEERVRKHPTETEKYPRREQIADEKAMQSGRILTQEPPEATPFRVIEGGAKESGKSNAPMEIITGEGPKTPVVPAQVLDDMRSAATHGELEDIGRHLNTLDDAIQSVHPNTKEAADYRKLYNELSRREDQLYDMGKSYEVAPWEERMKAAGIDPTSIAGKAISTAEAEINRAKEWLVTNRGATDKQKADVRKHIQHAEEFVDRHYSTHQSNQILKEQGLIDEAGNIHNPALDDMLEQSWERMVVEARDHEAMRRRGEFDVIEGGREFRRAVGRARKEAEDSYAAAKRSGEDAELLRQRDIYSNELRRVQAWQRRQVKDAQAMKDAGLPVPVDKFQGMIDQALENAAVAKGNIAQLTAQGDLFGGSQGIKGGLRQPANMPQQQYKTGDTISRDPRQLEMDFTGPQVKLPNEKKIRSMVKDEDGKPDIVSFNKIVQSVVGYDKPIPPWKKLTEQQKIQVFDKILDLDNVTRKDLSSAATPKREVPAKYAAKEYLIIDGHTGEIVGAADSRKAASRAREKRNLAYGGNRYYTDKTYYYQNEGKRPQDLGAARTPSELINYDEPYRTPSTLQDRIEARGYQADLAKQDRREATARAALERDLERKRVKREARQATREAERRNAARQGELDLRGAREPTESTLRYHKNPTGAEIELFWQVVDRNNGRAKPIRDLLGISQSQYNKWIADPRWRRLTLE